MVVRRRLEASLTFESSTPAGVGNGKPGIESQKSSDILTHTIKQYRKPARFISPQFKNNLNNHSIFKIKSEQLLRIIFILC